MRIHYILHAPFEKLGVIENWIKKNKYHASATHTYKGEKLPDVSEFDMLLIMGGPQSSTELDKHPYLYDEIELVKQAIRANKAVFGTCLGAQLISAALDATPERSPNREVGIYPVQVTPEALHDPVFKQFGKEFDVIHWHNDMPGIAEGAVLLAKSAGCPRQAFCYGDRVYGFQFHLEMTPDIIKNMIEHCAIDLRPGNYVHSVDELLQANLADINEKILVTLDYLAGRVKSSKWCQ